MKAKRIKIKRGLRTAPAMLNQKAGAMLDKKRRARHRRNLARLLRGEDR